MFRWLSKKRVKGTQLTKQQISKYLHGMEMDVYQTLASRTMREGQQEGKLFLHAIFGLISQIGQLIDIYKDEIQNDTPADDEHLQKQLGDALWYIAQLCTVNGWSLGKIAGKNIEKLIKRFPDGFDIGRDLNRDSSDI